MRQNKAEYAAIADRAAEALGALEPTRWQEAFDLIKDDTETVGKSEARYSDLDILRELGMASGGAILDKLEAALPARVVRAIQGDGIDLAHAETKEVLADLKTAGAISQSDYDALIGLTVEARPVFPRLRPGEVQNALLWRYEGAI